MIEKAPKFIKDFSKENASDERSEVARQIKQKRAEYFAKKSEHESRKNELEGDVREKSQEVEEILQELSGLEAKLEELSSSFLGKIKNVFQLRKVRFQIQNANESHAELQAGRDNISNQLEKLSEERSGGNVSKEKKESDSLLENFYADQRERWSGSGYDKEDIERYFTEEHLASLDIDEYALLLKRFPSQMITHVTRQGVRDHVNIQEHAVGQGEFFDGFQRLLEDGRLRSPLAVRMLEKEKEEAVASLFHLEENNREKALENLESVTNPDIQWQAGSYSDMRAVHFATERVANSYYGSETGNEIFFAYPSAFIAAQYHFAGELHARRDTGDQYNDQWVWDSEERGMDINAGIVFVPKDVQVDRRTGSRYELDENKNPIKNEGYRNIVRALLESGDFHDFANRRFQQRGDFKNMDLRKNRSHPSLRITENYLKMWEEEELKNFEPLAAELKDRYGIDDQRLLYAMLDYRNLQDLQDIRNSIDAGKELLPYQDIDNRIDRILEKEGILYKEATDTVSAQEFWEDYFQKNPGKKPSKIVYYGAVTPTRALFDWREKKGLLKRSEESHMGFPEKQVGKKSEAGSIGMERFKVLALDVIVRFYESRDSDSRHV